MAENDNMIHKEIAFEFMRERDAAVRERDQALAKLATYEKKPEEKKPEESAKGELPEFDMYGKPVQYFSVL